MNALPDLVLAASRQSAAGPALVSDGASAAVTSKADDAELLTLCMVLDRMRRDWQRLWEATPDDHDPKAPTDADRRFDEYCNRTWPGYHAPPDDDPVARLGSLPATTLEGMRAKAAALRALSDAGNYTYNCRDDECALVADFLQEVAGPLFTPVGEAAGTPA